jgi:hypothetical protein
MLIVIPVLPLGYLVPAFNKWLENADGLKNPYPFGRVSRRLFLHQSFEQRP